MKILHVTQTYIPTINGVAISVEESKKMLEKLGHEVVVLCPNNPLVKNEEKSIIRFPSIENPKVKDYPIPLLPGPKNFIDVLGKFRPDIVHTHHPTHVGHLARVIAGTLGVPLVFTYHTNYDLYSKEYLKFVPESVKKIMFLNGVDKFSRKVDHIIAPSKFMEDKLSLKYRFTPISYIPTPIVKKHNVKIDKKTISKKHNIPLDKKWLLSVGRLAVEKNQEALISAIKKTHDKYVLILVGDGPYRKNLENLVRKHMLTNRIFFIGSVPHEKIAEFYASSYAFVYSSETETQGIVFGEALSYGLPIVSLDSNAAREIATRDVGFVVKNPSEMAQIVNSLTDKKVGQLSFAATKKSKEYSPEVIGKKLEKLYQKLIEQRKLQEKITSTGWQSWSTKKGGIVKLPLRNFPPSNKMFLPNIGTQKTVKKNIVGWCSWYAYWWKINEEKIINQTEWFKNHKEIPVEYILIDDGWTRWGDWKTSNNDRFPKGMKSLNTSIKKMGFKPGVWLAPYLVDPKSQFAKEHSSFLVRHENKLIDGIKVTRFDKYLYPKYILDIRRGDVRSYLDSVVKKLVENDGFELLKLDFLYAPYFIPGIDAKEAGYFLNNFLLDIKKKYPYVYTIGCGCPFPPAIGALDSIRIGPDTSAPYLNKVPFLSSMFHKRRINLVIKNLKKRKWMSEYWNLDPDAFVCRGSLQINKSLLEYFREELIKFDQDIFLGDDFTVLPEVRIKKYIRPLFNK